MGGGEEMNASNLRYVTTSPSLLHALKHECQKAGAWGREWGSFSPQALEVTRALLYSQSGKGCVMALSRKQLTLCILGGGILFGVQEASSDHLLPSAFLNRNCSWSAQVVLSHGPLV